MSRKCGVTYCDECGEEIHPEAIYSLGCLDVCGDCYEHRDEIEEELYSEEPSDDP